MDNKLCVVEKFEPTLYEIDEKLTVKESLKIIKTYRTFKLGFHGYDTKVTSNYSLEPKNFSNQFHSGVEEAVIRKLDYLQMVEAAVNRIEEDDERRIIIDGYLSKDKYSWVKMSNMLHLSKTDYYRKRNSALIQLACALNKEVYKN